MHDYEAPLTPSIRSVVIHFELGGETMLTYPDGYSLNTLGEIVCHYPLQDGDKVRVTYDEPVMALTEEIE